MLKKAGSCRTEPKIWQYQEAKAKLSQVMDEVQEKGIQKIVRNRNEIYIILSQEKYEEYVRPKNSLLDFFLNAPCSDVEIDIERSKEMPREIEI